MESFATVVRSLLVRIRAFQASRSGNPWPPSAVVGGDAPIYRVAPSMWGLRGAGAKTGDEVIAGTAASPSARPATRRHASRRPLELTVYGLPVPRGLPAT